MTTIELIGLGNLFAPIALAVIVGLHRSNRARWTNMEVRQKKNARRLRKMMLRIVHIEDHLCPPRRGHPRTRSGDQEKAHVQHEG